MRKLHISCLVQQNLLCFANYKKPNQERINRQESFLFLVKYIQYQKLHSGKTMEGEERGGKGGAMRAYQK